MATKSYSTAGTLSVDQITDGSVRVWIKGLPKAAYPRKVTWKYKLSTASSYSTWGSTTIAKNATPNDSYYYNVGSNSDQRLIPGKTYNFMVSLTDTEDSKEYCKKYITASTAAATCTPTITATSSQITVQIPDLKPVAYYGRIVEVESMLVDIVDDYSIAARKFIRAGNTAPAPLTLTWKTNFFGENCKVRVNLWTGDAVDSYETKYKTITKSIFIPWDGVSVPKINSVAYTAPGASISVNWGLSLHYVDNLEETDFTFYIEREDGSIVQADTVRRTSAAAMTTDIDVSSWLLDDETVEVYIVASGATIQGTAQSNRYEIKLGRLFHWESEKAQGTPFDITAEEMNRLATFINNAHSVYPDYFNEVSIGLVSPGDEFTAAMANEIGFAVHQEELVLVDLTSPNTAVAMQMYNNGYSKQVASDVTGIISVTAEVTIGDYDTVTGEIEAELVTTGSNTFVHVLPNQSVFETGLAPLTTIIKLTAVCAIGETAQMGDVVGAADAKAFETYLNSVIKEAIAGG